MSCLVGGSGSSGTTLLKTVLDKHPEIFSGAEMALFNKERLYKDWSKWKNCLVSGRRSFSTDGWFPYPSHNLDHESYGWKKEEIAGLIEDSQDIMAFATAFFDRPLRKNNKILWVEKTPSNTYCFREFLKLSDKHRVIHMVRNPYDTVASLMRRGMSPIFAAGLWVYNNSAAVSAKNTSPTQYFLVQYEDFVESFEGTSSALFAFLGVSSIELDRLNESKSKSVGISSWNNNPSGEISKTSIGSFSKLNDEAQDTIKQALHIFRIRDFILEQKNLTFSNALQLCELYNFEYLEPKSTISSKHLRDLVIDFTKRSLRGYSTGLFKYPGRLEY